MSQADAGIVGIPIARVGRVDLDRLAQKRAARAAEVAEESEIEPAVLSVGSDVIALVAMATMPAIASMSRFGRRMPEASVRSAAAMASDALVTFIERLPLCADVPAVCFHELITTSNRMLGVGLQS